MRRTVYTFFRADGWYPMEFDSDEQAIENALCNPGTLRVVNEYREQTIWNADEQELSA